MRYLSTLLLFISLQAMAGTPTCHDHSGGAYCSYSGTVKQIYVNASNFILIYFENSIDVSTPAAYGLSVTNGGAAALKITDENKEFARMLYSTALAAKASGATIGMQMKVAI